MDDENEEQTPEILVAECDMGCGGVMDWCSCCNMWSNSCCIDYGTCMCS